MCICYKGVAKVSMKSFVKTCMSEVNGSIIVVCVRMCEVV